MVPQKIFKIRIPKLAQKEFYATNSPTLEICGIFPDLLGKFPDFSRFSKPVDALISKFGRVVCHKSHRIIQPSKLHTEVYISSDTGDLDHTTMYMSTPITSFHTNIPTTVFFLFLQKNSCQGSLAP